MSTINYFDEDWKMSKAQVWWAWRYALHGNKMRAVREAFKSAPGKPGYQNTLGWKFSNSPKMLRFVEHLISQHNNGEINLKTGPWKHFKDMEFGNLHDPGNRNASRIREIREKFNNEVGDDGQ